MGKPDIFDEIIGYLKEESGRVKYANVSECILNDFFSDVEKKPGKSAAQAKPSPSTPFHPSGRKVSEMDLDELRATVNNCTLCRLHESRTNTVFSDGDFKAKLMFIGEGPGRDEDEQGLPFVGRAGQLLTRMINAMQFERREVYIANIVKCRPPDNRNPEQDEAELCIPYLKRQIELVNPEVIVLLGAVPLRYILGKVGITKLHGVWHEYNGIKVMPTLHPAYLLRNPPAKKDAWEDLQKVMKVFGKVHKK
ncbi:MAG: hypothetical protein A2017_20355 [Lentisphaerae bacterium GWF2_44_16]|nr:MAG: hypothetical protein A2017_20355 [Lentisphaerae bacterium GWF2_44_16]